MAGVDPLTGAAQSEYTDTTTVPMPMIGHSAGPELKCHTQIVVHHTHQGPPQYSVFLRTATSRMPHSPRAGSLPQSSPKATTIPVVLTPARVQPPYACRLLLLHSMLHSQAPSHRYVVMAPPACALPPTPSAASCSGSPGQRCGGGQFPAFLGPAGTHIALDGVKGQMPA